MPRVNRTRTGKLAALRITAYVTEHFGTTRAAATALAIDHGTIWRAMAGLNKRGPGTALVQALADHSKKPTDYWLGRGE